jgi:hypothetical protein
MRKPKEIEFKKVQYFVGGKEVTKEEAIKHVQTLKIKIKEAV